MFQIQCENDQCSEYQVPKDGDDTFRDIFDAGLIRCGVCSTFITTEVTTPLDTETRRSGKIS